MQAENNFQELQIFEDDRLNIFFDDLHHAILQYTGETMLICGSIAKIFSGEFTEDYRPKDVDLEVSKGSFRILTGIFQKTTIPGIVMVEKKPERIILYTETINCIEIWNATNYYQYKITKFKDKIPFKKYVNTI